MFAYNFSLFYAHIYILRITQSFERERDGSSFVWQRLAGLVYIQNMQSNGQ